MKTLRIYISGTVQGVMFRKYIEEQANKIGVRGFVRNKEDGRVEVVIEGTDDKVLKMLETCKTGTQHAMVRNVEVNELKYQGFEGFRIMKL
jgi:acylphosphatase